MGAYVRETLNTFRFNFTGSSDERQSFATVAKVMRSTSSGGGVWSDVDGAGAECLPIADTHAARVFFNRFWLVASNHSPKPLPSSPLSLPLTPTKKSMASASKVGSSTAPKDSVAKQLLDSSAAVDVYFKVTGSCVQTGPETERSSDNLLCFPAEHTVYPMTVKTSSNRFALKKRFSQFVSLDAQMRATFEGTASAGKLPELPAKAYLGSASPVLIQERKTKLEAYMRTLVTVPEFRQCGPLLSFLDNAETETPSDKQASSLAFWPVQCKKCGQPLAAGREASEGLCNLCFRAHIGDLKSTQKR